MSKLQETGLESEPEALLDGIDEEKYIVATYYMAMKKDWNAHKVARAAAIEQSTGTWVPVPGETPEVRREHVAKAVGVYEVPNFEFEIPEETKERHYIIQIAYPFINFGFQFPMLFSTIVGNLSLGGKVKLLDLKFPKDFLKEFKGPKFGVKGVREILKVSERPLVNNMIKPCTGFPPDVGAKLVYAVSKGGVDLIKDDELLADAPFNKLEERVTKYMEAINKAEEETGEKTIYTINVTDKPSKVLENAEKVIELGANGLMINYLAVGLPILRELTEDPSVKVPVLGHMDVSGAMYESHFSGVSSILLLGKLPRLAGADIIVYPAPYGKAPILKEKYIQIAKAHLLPFQHIKQTFPMPSGGLTVTHLPELIKDLGYEFIVGVGGAIHAHPMGPEAGAKAFRQALDVLMQGKSLDDAVDEYKELSAAVEAAFKAIKEWKEIVS